MPLDPGIALSIRGPQIEPPANALMRAMQIQSMQQGNALQGMQMQDMQQQRAAQQQAAQAQQAAQSDFIAKFPAPPPDAPPHVQMIYQGIKSGAFPASPKLIMEAFQSPEAFKVIEGVDAAGNKTHQTIGKDGRPLGPAVPAYVAPVQVDQGGLGKTFAVPKAGASFPVTADANAVLSSDTQRRGQNMADSRARAGLEQSERQFQTTLAAKPPAVHGASESERTAGFLLQRIRDSQRQLDAALTSDPGAAKPGLIQEGARLVSEPLANSITGDGRQRVESAQLDILDAALTLGTGAAYTKEQLQGYRKSYFPQIGDSEKAVADKQSRLDNLIRAAETKAGRASADTAPAAAGPKRVNSVAEAQALKPGTRFIDPNGIERVR